MLLVVLFFYSFAAGFQFLQLAGCSSFSQSFIFNNDLYLFHLQHFFHTDMGLPHLVVRAFHNKLTIFVPDVLNAYFHYWDLLFIVSFIGILSTVGFVYAFWHVIKLTSRINTILGIFAVIFPIFIVLVSGLLPSIFWVLSLWVVWQTFALVGLWQLAEIKNKKITVFLSVMCLLTVLWILLFDQQVYSFCVKG